MAWEVYDRRAIEFVRIAAKRISFSRGCMSFLDKKTHVHLLVDREAKMAAVRPWDAEDPNAYRLRFTQDGDATISARAFCKEFSLERTGRLRASVADGMSTFSYALR